jgi:hypothetical protein
MLPSYGLVDGWQVKARDHLSRAENCDMQS